MIEPSDIPSGWATVSELARMRGVNKSAISKRVTRLEAQGLLHPKAGAHGTKLISLAEFERAVAQTTDAVRETNGRKAQAAVSAADPILSKEQARRASYDADLKKLDLEERLGLLMPVEETRRVATDCALRLRQAVEALHSRAEEVAAAQARDGSAFARALVEATRDPPQAARAFFKALAREQLTELSHMATALERDWQDASTEEIAEEAVPA